MELTPSIGPFEQQILTAVKALQDYAYGGLIHSKVCEIAGREMDLGSVYVNLHRLHKKGFVSCKIARPEPGGKPRQVYSLKPAGLKALRESIETADRVSEAFWSTEEGKEPPAKARR